MTLSLNFIGIATRDLMASLDFYRALGVPTPELPADAPHAEAVLPGGTTLAWDPITTLQSFRPGYELPEGEGRITFASEAGSPAEVDRHYAEIIEQFPAAAHTAPWDAPWGQRYATVVDPDGNTVDLYAALAEN